MSTAIAMISIPMNFDSPMVHLAGSLLQTFFKCYFMLATAVLITNDFCEKKFNFAGSSFLSLKELEKIYFFVCSHEQATSC